MGGLKVTTISTAEPTSGFGPTDDHQAAESVDCQMVGANRVAQQLNVQTDASQSCKGVNKVAQETAFGLMTKRSQDRYLQEARGWCFMDDSSVSGNIGPLFLDGSISLTETTDCLQVTSLALKPHFQRGALLQVALSSDGHGVDDDGWLETVPVPCTVRGGGVNCPSFVTSGWSREVPSCPTI